MTGVFQFKSQMSINIGDCRAVTAAMVQKSQFVDAIVTDPPYEINYLAKAWDNSGIAVDPTMWRDISAVLKPGGFLVAFASARLYHAMASAIEAAGFETYPCMMWSYPSGMPKPQNVSKLFDRDNCHDRVPIGTQKAAGYNSLQIRHGQQNYQKLEFDVYEADISAEARSWSGYFYGKNTLKPGFDLIYMGRKPISEPRVIDNIRVHGVGALNVRALRDRGAGGGWPSNVLQHGKARAADHQTGHPTVKPVPLMEDLVALVCPRGGTVLDPFAGTGTTGVACGNLGYHCTLIDLNPEMEAVMRQRLAVR